MAIYSYVSLPEGTFGALKEASDGRYNELVDGVINQQTFCWGLPVFHMLTLHPDGWQGVEQIT